MGRHNGIKRRIRRNRSALKYRRQLTVILSVVVVFLMVWALVVPASTLTKKEAKKQGGVDVPAVESVETVNSEKTDSEKTESDEDTSESSGNEEKEAEKKDAAKRDEADSKKDQKDEKKDGKEEDKSDKEKSTPAGKLKYNGAGFDLEAAYGKDAKLPEDTKLAVKEIGEKADPKKYEKYYDKALEAVKKALGKNKVEKLSFAKFYDITLTSDGDEIEPEDKVKVTISYDTGLKAKEADHVRVIHFTENEKTGALTAELLGAQDVDAKVQDGKMSKAEFDAESFSVYAVVYTVDFEYEPDDQGEQEEQEDGDEAETKKFEYSLTGGGCIALSDLARKLSINGLSKDSSEEDINTFLNNVERVEFSDSSLVWTGKADKDMTVSEIKEANDLKVQYSSELTTDQIDEINAQSVKAGDWALISLKPFTTNESLTITMKDGDVVTVKVTDGQEVTDYDGIDKGKYYYIYVADNQGRYYALKNDGSSVRVSGNDLESLGEDFLWCFDYDQTACWWHSYNGTHYIEPEWELVVGSDPGGRYLWVDERDDGNGFSIHGNQWSGNYLSWDAANGFKIVHSWAGDTIVPIRIYEKNALAYTFSLAVNNENYGSVSSESTETDTDYKNTKDIVATPAEGCNFVGWRLGDEALSGFDATIPAGALQFESDNQTLTAVFSKNYTSPATQEINEWVDSFLGNPLESDKTAHVYDYDNRIYEIDLSASSSRYTIDDDIRIEFITDISRSMYFPQTLMNEQDFHVNGQINLGQWLLNNGDPEQVYYVLADINNTATMYAVYFSGNQYFTRWSIVDASYYLPYDGASTSGRIKQVCQISNGRTTINMTDRFDDNANRMFTGKIYTSTPKPPKDTADWDRLSYLTAAVNAVSRAIYQLDPGAQLGLVTFASAASGGTLYGADDQGAFETALHSIQPTGGTNQTSAFNLINNSNPPVFTTNSGKRQVALLITDGAPQGTTWTDIERAAGVTESKDVEIWTLGLGLERVGNNKQKLMDLASDGGYAGNAEDPDQLVAETKKILEKMLVKASVYGEVYDTVDPAFYPVDADGNPIEEGYYYADTAGGNVTKHTSAPSDASKPYYRWVNEDDKWSVSYYNQEIKWPDQGGWKESFYIKAKEDFMGGNTISTNTGFDNRVEANRVKHSGSADGYYWLNEDHSSFRNDYDSPHVNVDELSLNENSTQWRVYLGTEVDPASELKALWNKIRINQVVKDNGEEDEVLTIGSGEQKYYSDGLLNDSPAADGTSNETLPLSHFVNADIIDGLIQSLDNNETSATATRSYRYFPYGHELVGTFDIVLTKTLTDDDAAADHAPSPHVTKETGENREVYTLTVNYNPVNNGASETYSNTTSGKSAGKVADGYDGTTGNKIESENEHRIHVYARTIEVEKLKETADSTELLTDKQATFALYRRWKESDGDEAKKTLTGYTLGGTAQTDDDYYVLVETKQTTDGLAKFSADLSAAESPYYLVETQVPEGYQDNKVIQTVTVTPGPDTKTDLSGIATTEMPYNWEQEVSVNVDGTEASYVDADEAYKTSVINTPLGYLQIHKEVKYNGQAPSTDEQKEVLAGIYTYKVYADPNCEDVVKVNGEEVTLTVEIDDDGVAKDSNVVALPVGTYWLKEILDDDSYVLPVGDNPAEITIAKGDTTSSPKVVDSTNDYEFNEEDDNIALDILKKFTGLDAHNQIPAGFKAVLSYEYGGQTYNVDLGNSAHVTETGVQVKIEKSEDQLTWTWHVYNIPKGSTNFKIHEENYEKTGYDAAVYLDGEEVTDPESDQTLSVTVPAATITTVTDKRITSENDLRTYYVGSDYVLIVSINPRGSLVISDKSLNFLQRSAIENAIRGGQMQGSYSAPVRFYSTEQHPASIRLDSKRVITVSTDGEGNQTVYLPPNTNSMAGGFYVKYDNDPAYYNGTLQNDYTETGVDLEIVKVDATDMETPLEKARFTLKKLDPKDTGAYITGEGAVEKVSGETGDDGKTTITGIKNGYYEVTESKTPAGYIRIDDGKFYIKVFDGGMTRIAKTEDDPATTDTNEGYVENWPEMTDNTGTIRYDKENKTATVGNTPGTPLPHTGGPGTTLFYLLGALLTLGGGILLVSRRRMVR